MSELVSFSEFARSRGVSAQAVSKAVKSGRFQKALTQDAKGRPSLVADVAQREWEENTSRPTKPATEAAYKPERRRLWNDHAAGNTAKVPLLDADQLAVWTSQGAVWLAVLRFDGDLDRDYIVGLTVETARLLADKLSDVVGGR